jgi:hypothetical protein
MERRPDCPCVPRVGLTRSGALGRSAGRASSRMRLSTSLRLSRRGACAAPSCR